MQALRSDSDGTGNQRVPAFYKRRKKRGNEIGQLLLRKGAITAEQLRQALRLQEEQGGHVGAVLIGMGACDSRAIASALIEQVQLAREAGKASNLALRARENPSIVGLQSECRPGLTRLLVLGVDLSALLASFFAAWALTGTVDLEAAHFYGISAVALLSLLGFLSSQLYASPPPSPPEEIRRSTLCITIVCLSFIVFATLGHLAAFFGIGFFAWGLGWLLAVLLVPIGRAVLRSKYARKPFWGSPVVVLGAGKVGRAVVATLQRRPQLGIKPVAILDDDPAKHGTLRASFGEEDIMVESVRAIALHDKQEGSQGDMVSPSMRAVWGQFSEVEGIPVVGGLELAPVLSQRLKIKTAVVAMPEMDSPALLAVIERFGGSFTNVLVIPDLLNLAHFGAPTRDLGGTIGIEVRRQLLLTGPRIAKRAIDIVLTVIGGLCILPILVGLAIVIAIDSPGGPFYRQKRLGQDGVRFMALKFRTMYGDGEKRLQEVLERDPKLRAEYDEFHKLTFDPRVTRAGRFLRKYSLDELPQLWNVLMGEMSLVGPRPYLEREIPEMIQQEAVILRVKPGMTGIWQVTERNASTFEQRVQLDVEYVRNWSPWLDIYVLARTIPVVIGGTGS